jgi:hypothetical protein
MWRMTVDGRRTNGGARKGAGRPKGDRPPLERLTFRPTAEQMLALKKAADARGIVLGTMMRVVVSEWLDLETLGWTTNVR